MYWHQLTAVHHFPRVLSYRKGCDWTLVSPSSSAGRSSDHSPPPVPPDFRCRSSSGWTALYQFCGPLSGVSTGLRASSSPWPPPCTLFTIFTAFTGSWSNFCMVVIVKLVRKLSHLFRSPEAGKHTCRWSLRESSAHTQTHTCRIRLKSNSRLKNSQGEARNSLLYWILRSGLQLSAVSINYGCFKVLCVFSVFRTRRPWGDEKGGDSKSCSHPAQSRLMVHTLLWSLSRAKPRPRHLTPPLVKHTLSLSPFIHTITLSQLSGTFFCPSSSFPSYFLQRLTASPSDMTQLETLLWEKAFHRKTPSSGCWNTRPLYYYSLCMLNKNQQRRHSRMLSVCAMLSIH